MKKIIKSLFWTPIIVLILFYIFIALMSLSEWWNIRIKNEKNQYAWGTTNENSWIYETPNLYSNVMLIEGFLMMLLVIITIRKIYMKQNFNYWLLSCLGLFLLILISGNIR